LADERELWRAEVRRVEAVLSTRLTLRSLRMDDRERRLLHQLYELQVELFNHQGDEIEALKKANQSLQRSHEVIGQMLKLTADLLGFS
jgi:hypothetical protein